MANSQAYNYKSAAQESLRPKGWQTRRHETKVEQMAARKHYCRGFDSRKEARQASAKNSAELRYQRTVPEQLRLINERRGESRKEKKRLLALLAKAVLPFAKEKEQSAAHSVPETKRSENEKPRKIVRKPFGK